MIRSAVAIVLFLLCMGAMLHLPVVAAPPALTDGGVDPELTLKGQLEKGLRARRPVEFQYIADIVKLVDDGKLPRSMVDATFLYARKKKRPLQRFQFALDAQAKPLGIAMPKLDLQLVELQ